MINWHYEEVLFRLESEEGYANWVERIIKFEGSRLGEITYIFCTDDYLLGLNKEFLNHDEYTDIITFDYCEGKEINGDIFISVERVKENAEQYESGFPDEVKRVMAHGVLHLLGYGDKSDDDIILMRAKEVEMIKLFHVEH
jgi:rRNA maturation RNase YbeY